MHQMPADAQKKDPLVFLRTAVLFCYGDLPGAWIYEGKDPGKEVRAVALLWSKDG